MLNKRIICSLFAAIFFAAWAAAFSFPVRAAVPIPPLPVVKTQLLVDGANIHPGDTVWVGVKFTMPPHWHIYAKEPGDSGIPTSYEWTLPPGMTAGDIVWPKPETLMIAGFTTFGYSNEVILPVPLHITEALTDRHITLKASWLACADTCIPESASFSVELPKTDAIAAKELAEARGIAVSPTTSLSLYLALAFLGGLLLNIMPCVLPILSLKCLTLVKKSAVAPHIARAHGLAYTAGVIGSFLLIAIIMLGLRASGEAIGWGFQLQSPLFVLLLALLMFAVSANFAGLFQLPALFGSINATHERIRGSALTGVLAVAVATPCTAPFMATAVGATLLLPHTQSLLVFAAMGLGMASPFLLVSLWPAALRLLPKPGAWMHRFKQILAIPMALTALWLAFVFLQLVQQKPMDLSSGYEGVTVETYSPARLAELRAQHKPVLLDATAAWCLTCKVNEHVALKPAATQAFLRDNHITLMIADWTKRDPEIAALLAEFNRNGVPLYVFYPPSGEPILLPQVLTPQMVTDTLQNTLHAP